MAESPMQKHLRTYVEDGIKQKVRLTNLVLDYKKQEEKSRERVIDQNSLIGKMTGDGAPKSKIDFVKNRRDRDQRIFERVQVVAAQSNDEMVEMTMRMNTHVEELAEIEINSGGFVRHAIGTDKGAKLDTETNVVKFEVGGHIEIPIGTKMATWKDSSQLTIKKIKKAGV